MHEIELAGSISELTEEEAAMAFIQGNALAFKREGMPTLTALLQRPDLMPLSLSISETPDGLITPAAFHR